MRALGESEAATGGIRLALVQGIALDYGLAFSSIQDARRFQAEEIMRARGFGDDVGAQIFTLSNGFTDEIVARMRGFFLRLMRR